MTYNMHQEPDDSPPERDEHQESVDEQLTKDAIYSDNASKRADEYLKCLFEARANLLSIYRLCQQSIRNIDELITKHES